MAMKKYQRSLNRYQVKSIMALLRTLYVLGVRPHENVTISRLSDGSPGFPDTCRIDID